MMQWESNKIVFGIACIRILLILFLLINNICDCFVKFILEISYNTKILTESTHES